jgi:hypothetical protein
VVRDGEFSATILCNNIFQETTIMKMVKNNMFGSGPMKMLYGQEC